MARFLNKYFSLTLVALAGSQCRSNARCATQTQRVLQNGKNGQAKAHDEAMSEMSEMLIAGHSTVGWRTEERVVGFN
jgi:hypothetical protein